ncbi:TNF receptor-associated factor family protein DDB_G0293202-like [Actinia tenebrosa]|uniref:TNF receptor-associated factor family protein DDB_G0293202-like n=1 Tax=Actinia tenebrosa TaxID=6105 RepID=A0A6P8HWW4_ACTTE|nr:TNF receptor-associated factor family protein DDB_G0293202-like [Actinia tenebrosa]XP_031560884.1 TNF receptor-associated factor family protein DDB_G0293202-like [Actinia tenebrosa]
MQNNRAKRAIQASLGKPFECFCSLLKPSVLVIDGYEIVVCECPNNISGCNWKGKLNHYLLDHRKRCNFQVVQCYCGNQMYKGYIAHHLSSECKHRLVDYKLTYELDDMYVHQRCPRCCYGCKWYGTCTKYEKVTLV